MSDADSLRRFLFEDAPLRGHWVRLVDTWREARVHQSLPPAVRDLLGEALAAAALLAASLKFDGTLTLQLRGGSGQVSMLIAQATSEHTLRGVAHCQGEPDPGHSGFADLVGKGQLVITVERGGGAAPWQGIVPLDEESLAACLERYFEVSEQLPTRVVLAADAGAAGGLLLQKLPAPGGEAAEARLQDLWEEAGAMLATLSGAELLVAGPQVLLTRLFGGHDLRLFDADTLRFACRCSRQRVGAMLQALGREEVDSILAEQGAVTVTCEFCMKPYRFDAVDAAQLFTPPAGGGSTSLN
ncbi:MAG: Hsp33 family molecular chaperone HslO [Steroidobacteraceae bacterium]